MNKPWKLTNRRGWHHFKTQMFAKGQNRRAQYKISGGIVTIKITVQGTRS